MPFDFCFQQRIDLLTNEGHLIQLQQLLLSNDKIQSISLTYKLFLILKMRRNFQPQRDYAPKTTFGGNNLTNLNSRMLDKSRQIPKSNQSQNYYQNQNQSYYSDQSSDFNLSAILNTGEVFPQDLLMLLVEENNNIKSFKGRIQKEKGKVLNDMDLFKKEIIHIIEDLKISMLAELDLSYKLYIEKYAFLKSQVQQIRRLKKQIQAQNVGRIDTRLHSAASNSQMVRQIQQEVNNLRNYKISQYVNDIQRKKLFPLLQLSKELIILTTSPFQFYDAAATSTKLGQVKQAFGHFTQHLFAGLKQLVRTPEGLLQKGKTEFNDGLITDRVEQMSEQSSSSQSQFEQINKNKVDFVISQSQQVIATPWVQNIKAKLVTTIKPPHSDIILCMIGVKNRYIVSGGKDALLNVMEKSGNKVATLRGHEASVCSLALIEARDVTYLVSGGDHGCCSLIVWDVNNWTIKSKLKYHTAAVTCIVDLEDGQTMISGSYDKKINLYNYRESALMYSLPNNKSPVAAMTLNASKDKLISTGLDGKIYVWNITRGANGIVESINSEKILSNDQVICSLNSSLLKPSIIFTGTMDGKIKFWNIMTGQTQKILVVNDGPIVELTMIERESKPDFPILLSCSAKDQALTITKTQTATSSLLDLQNRLYLQFGCGIGPKVIFDKVKDSPALAVLSHSVQSPEITLFQLDFK